jgi:hypothetical protein
MLLESHGILCILIKTYINDANEIVQSGSREAFLIEDVKKKTVVGRLYEWVGYVTGSIE